MITYTEITTDEGLDALAARLLEVDRVYLDTEFESRREGTKLCLLQISDGQDIYLIDPFAFSSLRSLAGALGRPECEWVVHAGKQDVALLQTAFALETDPTLFDTQVAWSMVSPEFQVSLAYLEAVFFKKSPEKGRRTDDWRRRPLSPEQLDYAAADVALLPELYNVLSGRLKELDRLQFVDEVTYESYFPPKADDRRLSLKNFRNLWELDNRQRALLVFMIDWYNRLDGRDRSRAPHRKILLSIARRLPESMAELLEIKGVNRGWGNRDGQLILEAIHRIIKTVPLVEENHAPKPYSSFDDLYLDAWFQCARADVCASAQIAPELAFPSWLVKALRSHIDGGGDWAAAGAVFKGWREFLSPYWMEFCKVTKGE